MSTISILLIILAIVLLLVGIVGAVLPALPGPPLSWGGMLVIYLAFDNVISTSELLWMLFATAVVTALDYIAPIVVTKWGGGSKAATVGATLGLVIGLFMGVPGLIFGPLVGAFVGEYMHDQKLGKSLRVACLSFIGFLLTTGLKLMITIWMAYDVVAALITLIK